MKKLTISLLLAAGLIFIDASPASAHSGVDRPHVRSYGHQVQVLRHHQMPDWLRRDHRFRHWYRHTPLRHYRQIGWNQLFEIYRWERRYYDNRHYMAYDDKRHWKDRHKRYRHDD